MAEATKKYKYKDKEYTYKTKILYVNMTDDTSKKIDELLEIESQEAGASLNKKQAFERFINKAYKMLVDK